MNERMMLYQARQAVYALLRRLYTAAPDQMLLQWLTEERPFADFPVLLGDEVEADLKALDEACQDPVDHVLFDDFYQLYVGSGDMRVPPWESVYRSEAHDLFDVHTLQVRAEYARYGMEFVDKNKTPEDSIAIELEFMHTLGERMLTALDKEDAKAERLLADDQAKFLEEHLLTWVPEFVSRTQQHARTPFYRSLAGVLLGFLKWDRETLQEIVALFPEDTELEVCPD
jgi:TorA maturation chaperone TorD